MATTLMAIAAACGPLAASAEVHTVDSTGAVGRYSSIAIGVDGLPIVSYLGAGLKVAHCADRACAAASIATLDNAGGAGAWTSIAIGSDDVAVIAYQATFDDDLKIAHCDDTECSDAAIFYVDPDLDDAVGEYASMTMGAGGFPVISYYDATNGEMQLAICTSSACPASTKRTIDSGGDDGRYSSIALGADGLPLISYYNAELKRLKIAHCADPECNGLSINSPNTGRMEGADTSIAIGVDGLGIVAYRDLTNGALRMLHCSELDCETSTSAMVDNAATDVGRWTDIAIGDDGLARISYWDLTNGLLKLARCLDTACTSARVSSLAHGGTLGGYTSIAIDGSGQPVISFYDGGTADLRVAYPGLHSDGFEAGNLAGWAVNP